MKWLVVEQAGGQVCALSGNDAKLRPAYSKGEKLLWEGEAADNFDALNKASAAGPELELWCEGYRVKR